jgi:hypothetical protein
LIILFSPYLPCYAEGKQIHENDFDAAEFDQQGNQKYHEQDLRDSCMPKSNISTDLSSSPPSAPAVQMQTGPSAAAAGASLPAAAATWSCCWATGSILRLARVGAADDLEMVDRFYASRQLEMEGNVTRFLERKWAAMEDISNLKPSFEPNVFIFTLTSTKPVRCNGVTDQNDD